MRASAYALVIALAASSVADAEETAELVSARLAGHAAATPFTFSDGPIKFEVLVKNAGDAPLRTNLIIEIPTGRTSQQKSLYRKAWVDVPARSSKYIPFDQPAGFASRACHWYMLYYVRLENGAAAAKTVRVRPTCTFSVVPPSTFPARPQRVFLKSLDVVPSRLYPDKRFSCQTGLALEAKLENATAYAHDVAVSVGKAHGRTDATSPKALVPPGATATLKLGWFLPSFSGTDRRIYPSIRGPGTNYVVTPPSFEILRRCEPIVEIVDGQVDGLAMNYRLTMDSPREIGFSIVSAQYGTNCKLPIAKADISGDVVSQCKDAGTACDYKMTWAPWGGRDPDPSLCKKSIDIAYQCDWSGPVKYVKVLHEKTPQIVKLSCQ